MVVAQRSLVHVCISGCSEEILFRRTNCTCSYVSVLPHVSCSEEILCACLQVKLRGTGGCAQCATFCRSCSSKEALLTAIAVNLVEVRLVRKGSAEGKFSFVIARKDGCTRFILKV